VILVADPDIDGGVFAPLSEPRLARIDPLATGALQPGSEVFRWIAFVHERASLTGD
jgi:hypothetical protein